MKKIVLGIVLMLVTAAFTVSAATEEKDQNVLKIGTNTQITMPGGTEELPVSVDLIADGGDGVGFIVGHIDVWNDDEYLYIKYFIEKEGEYGPWEMTESHVHIGNNPGLYGKQKEWDFPLTKSGNPKVGQFNYGEDHDPAVTEYLYTIAYDGETYIAVHCVVQTICEMGGYADLEYIEANLPDQVSLVVAHPGTGYGDPSYFDMTISGGTALDGTYDSYCIDNDHTISSGHTYTADVYSSYEDLPTGLVEYPENLDKVNWILNQEFVGQTSPCNNELYTYGDVQRAIWALIEDSQSTNGLGTWYQCHVDEILAGANAYGEDFIPECGGSIAVVLAPVDGEQVVIAQVIVGEVEVAPCTITTYCGETAWAKGTEFFGNSWAMYFEYGTGQNNPIIKEIPFRALIQMFFARILEMLKVA